MIPDPVLRRKLQLKHTFTQWFFNIAPHFNITSNNPQVYLQPLMLNLTFKNKMHEPEPAAQLGKQKVFQRSVYVLFWRSPRVCVVYVSVISP